MPDYRRNRVPGGTFVFTVNRRTKLPVARIDALRDAIRQARAPRTFPYRRRPTSFGFDFHERDVILGRPDHRSGLASNRGGAPLAGGTNVVANKSRRGTYSRSTTRQFYHPRECDRNTDNKSGR
jgi:hypothetical protein